MKFSRAVVLSSALLASSAAAFSIPTASSAPKTALYASSHDEGVLERRQVLASFAATTAVTLGVSAANAISGTDVKQAAGDAVDNIKGSTDIGNPVEKAKSATNSFSFPNPFAGAGRKADEVASKGRDAGRDVGRKGQEIANQASDATRNPLQGNQNPVEATKSVADSSNLSNNPLSGSKAQGSTNANPFDNNQNPLNKDINPFNNKSPIPDKNPLNQSSLTKNSPGSGVASDSLDKQGSLNDLNLPGPGDAANKVKDAVSGGGNLFSKVQTSASTNLPTSPDDKNSKLSGNDLKPSDDALNLNSIKSPNPFATASNN